MPADRVNIKVAIRVQQQIRHVIIVERCKTISAMSSARVQHYTDYYSMTVFVVHPQIYGLTSSYRDVIAPQITVGCRTKLCSQRCELKKLRYSRYMACWRKGSYVIKIRNVGDGASVLQYAAIISAGED